MERHRSNQFKDIIDLSRQMLEKACAEDWGSVAELECRRRVLLMQCFSCPTSEQDAPAVADCIRQTLELNDQITRLGRGSRDQLAAEIHTHRAARAVSSAYLGCAG